MDRDKYKETFETWNNIASLYQDKFMHLDLYNETYDFVCKALVKPNACLLEIGCGPGNITRYLLTQRPDFQILGIDIAPNMIALAKMNNPDARFEVMDCREIDGIKSKFDGIVAGFCMPYLSQSECGNLIANSYNLLNENGLIYLSFVEGDPEQSDFKVGSGGRVYFQYHTLVDTCSLLKQQGFGEIMTFKVDYKVSDKVNDVHTVLIARKIGVK